MAQYKLAALDMDGTLLNSDHEITPYTKDVLTRATASGKIIALSTGRAMSELRRHLNAVPAIGYVIGESGAWVYDVTRDHAVVHIALDDGDVDAVLDGELNDFMTAYLTWQSLGCPKMKGADAD